MIFGIAGMLKPAINEHWMISSERGYFTSLLGQPVSSGDNISATFNNHNRIGWSHQAHSSHTHAQLNSMVHCILSFSWDVYSQYYVSAHTHSQQKLIFKYLCWFSWIASPTYQYSGSHTFTQLNTSTCSIFNLSWEFCLFRYTLM